MERVKDQVGQPERGQIAENDRGDQVKADAGPAEQDDQDHVNPECDQYVHPLLVAGGHAFQVVDHRRRARDADRGRPFQRLARGRGGLQYVVDSLQSEEAGCGERIGIEEHVETRDVVAVRVAGGPDADVPRFGRGVQEPGPARRLRNPPSEACTRCRAERLRQRTDFGDVVDRLQAAIDLVDRPASLGERKSSRGLSTRATAGLSSPTAK